MSRIRLVLLGTGAPGSIGELNDVRAGASNAIQVGDDVLVFDCGRWITLRLLQSHIHPKNVNYLFFTHFFHTDHTYSYPDLILSRAGTNLPLHVSGPKGLKVFTEGIFKAFSINRIGGPIDSEGKYHSLDIWDTMDITEVDEGLVYQTESWRVLAVKTTHGNSLAYRFEANGKSIVISGDITVMFTPEKRGRRPSPQRGRGWRGRENAYQANQELIDLAKGTDIFIMDADGGHVSPEAVGRAAQEACVKKVILTHLEGGAGQRLDLEALRDGVKKFYSGELVMGEDLMVIDLDE